MNKIKGIVPVLHTPINKQGGLDLIGLERLVDFLSEKPVGGLWVLGTGGEDMNLSYNQRLSVVNEVVTVAQGRVPLLIGASFFAFVDTENFIKDLNKYDIAGIHFMQYHNLLGLDQVKWSYKKIASISDHPVWMYSSANWGRTLPPSFVEEMKETKNILGVKYSTSNAVHMSQVSALADDSFNVLSAVASTLYSSLCLGVDGATSSIAGPLPEILLDIYDSFVAGDHESALLAQRRLNNFLAAWPKKISECNFLKCAEEKTILKYRGICDAYTTSYYKDADKLEAETIINALGDFYPSII